MSGFDRLLTKAASVMSQKMADLVLVLWQSLRESVFIVERIQDGIVHFAIKA